MCGRFTLTATTGELSLLLSELQVKEEFLPRYNIAPTQEIAIIKSDEVVELSYARWGLIPRWAKDASIGSKLINARGESIQDKPSFRESFKQRRCLIPASGFFEWKTVRKGLKQPMYIRLKSRQPFMFAGLWDKWEKEDDITSCTIITTSVNDLIKPIHNRMPVILPINQYHHWLTPGSIEMEQLNELLLPYPPDEMEMYPVSNAVNNIGINDSTCIEISLPTSEQASLF